MPSILRRMTRVSVGGVWHPVSVRFMRKARWYRGFFRPCDRYSSVAGIFVFWGNLYDLCFTMASLGCYFNTKLIVMNMN